MTEEDHSDTFSEIFRVFIFTFLILTQFKHFHLHRNTYNNTENSHQINRIFNVEFKQPEINIIQPPHSDKIYPKPTILFWDLPYRGFNCLFKPLCGESYNCDCRIGWWNEEVLEKSDAVVISPVGNSKLEEKLDKNHSKNYDAELQNFKQTIDKFRRPSQLYVFFQSESPGMPIHQHDYTGFDNVFNATLSYRLDSTYKSPYGSIGLLENKYGWKVKDLPKFESKNLGVLSVISNCASNYRNQIVKKLVDLIKLPNGNSGLDVFGNCAKIFAPNQTSKINVPRGPNEIDKLSKNYKFYLSFENSKCKYYITEKFFENGIKNGLVPIVSGAKRQEYEKFVPGSAFIHVDDFKTLEALSDRVNYLLKNDTAYQEYFDWRTENEVIDNRYFAHNKEALNSDFGWCKLCKDLNSIRDGSFKRLPVIKELHKFWYGSTENQVCRV